MNILDLGPLYGPVNQDGLPIIGQSVFKELFTGEWDEEWPLNVLRPGCHDFTKIYIQDGQLMASGNMQEPPVIPAMWDYDDLQVIVALIYGLQDQENTEWQAVHRWSSRWRHQIQRESSL
jgi:hypothetical protein